MYLFQKRYIVWALLVVSLFAFIIYIVTKNKNVPIVVPPTEVIKKADAVSTQAIIGASVEGRSIKVYTYGTGKKHLVFVGGIHGGYEWNSVYLAYSFMDYFESHPESIPSSITIDIIPSVNPDAVQKVAGKEGRFKVTDITKDVSVLAEARFNANGVDLNRNFDCKWKSKSTWRNKSVSAGTAPFSEPETRALKSFILKRTPSAVVFWHSQANGVYASQCQSGILPETIAIMNTYAKASGYPGVKSFDAYEVTGAADDWLASINIPAVTVELKTHETIEWDANLAGIQALLKQYAQ